MEVDKGTSVREVINLLNKEDIVALRINGVAVDADYDVDEDTQYNIRTMAGSYVFEVAKRNFGGKYYWLQSEQQPILIAGEPDFTVSIKAWDKVKKYMENGSEDDLKYYIEGYKEYIEKGKKNKGYSAHII